MPKSRRIYVWSATTGHRVGPSTRKRKLNVSVNGTRLYGAAAASVIAKWRQGATRTGPPVKVKREKRGPRRKPTAKLVRGVPREYLSPFKKFLENPNKLKPRQRADMIALVEVEHKDPSPSRGRILPAGIVVRPFKLGRMTLKQAQALSREDIARMYVASGRAGQLNRIVGVVALKPRERRKGIRIRK